MGLKMKPFKRLLKYILTMIALLVFSPIIMFCVLAELFGDKCDSVAGSLVELRWRLSNTDISDIVGILKDLRCAVGWHFKKHTIKYAGLVPGEWKCKRCCKTGEK